MEDIKDANILITDKIMKDVYKSTFGNNIINLVNKSDLNLSTTTEKVLELNHLLNDHFYLIAGSSNFHHLDISNIKRIVGKLNQPIQLVLFDHHMDSQDFSYEKNELHCGNWVGYGFEEKLISKIAIIGSVDYRKLNDYYPPLKNSSDLLLYSSTPENSIDETFLDKNLPVYLSIDTDILDSPSDWGKGDHSLDSVLSSPIWEQLKNYNLVGACILGHVTDNRKFFDMIKKGISDSGNIKRTINIKNAFDYLVHGILPKFWAEISSRPLPINEQMEIIKSLYLKIESIRSK